MDLIILVLILALIGCAVWALTTYIPMDPMFRTMIYVIVAVALILFLIRRFSGSVPNVMN
jgi:hypothetical protein